MLLGLRRALQEICKTGTDAEVTLDLKLLLPLALWSLHFSDQWWKNVDFGFKPNTH